VHAPPVPIRIGVSACLLGEEVRFDGGHKRDTFLTDVLDPHVELIPVCPEVEVGMGTPREALRLVRRGDEIRMITTRTGIDHTDAMHRWAAGRLDALERADLSGYVLKKDSPSCGMDRVKTYSGDDEPRRDGRGLFAAALLERMPLLPVEEEARLADPVLRENFIERVFAYRRLQDLFRSDWDAAALAAFHSAHRMALLAHSPGSRKELERLLARAESMPETDLREQYSLSFMKTLAIPATRARHAVVLRHMAAHLKKQLDISSREELAHAILDFRHGFAPLVVPLTLVRHHAHVHGIAYLEGQTYLAPHPAELMLRNHA
jgi:uncharacterized protein YbbK (DUF523 family)/uncharacterized protein YbgA (DUF1722 family)